MHLPRGGAGLGAAERRRPLDTHAHCVTGTVTLLDAARRAGVRRLVYAASSSAYGDQPNSSKRETDLPAPLSPYAAAKLAGRVLLPGVHGDLRVGDGRHPLLQRLRPAAGPQQPILGRDSAVHHGDARRPAADDLRRRPAVARFHLRGQRGPRQPAGGRRAGRRPGGCSTAPTAGRTDLLTLIRLLNRLLGTNVQPIHDRPRVGDVRESLADITQARKLLGYETAGGFRGRAAAVDRVLPVADRKKGPIGDLPWRPTYRRAESLQLLRQYNQTESLVNHALAVEANNALDGPKVRRRRGEMGHRRADPRP